MSRAFEITRSVELPATPDDVWTAITYDPAFDLPARLHVYGRDRGVLMNAHHRLLRATDGMDALCAHFGLGVNFIDTYHRSGLYPLPLPSGAADGIRTSSGTDPVSSRFLLRRSDMKYLSRGVLLAAALASLLAPLSTHAQAPKGKLVLYTSQPEPQALTKFYF